LQQLTNVLPPPADPAGVPVDWGKCEREIGIVYPSSFKVLVDTYGHCIWFDLYSILFPFGNDLATYRQTVRSHLDLIARIGATDEQGERINVSLYPEPGGLFPFMADSDGTYYFWRMRPADPNRWPLLRWEVDTLRELDHPTLPAMMLTMVDWFTDNEPERITVERAV
jgi:hypothetical protein